MHPIKHSNGRTDGRYTVTSEYDGHIQQTYVVRFCGEWIAAFANEYDAVHYAMQHNKHRVE